MRLLNFSGIAIPDNNASDSIGASTRTNQTTLRAGVIDMDGANAYPEVNQYGRQGWFIESIDQSISDLKQRMGKGLGYLRAKMRDNTLRMTPAKITDLNTNADANSYDCWQPYTVRFQQTYPYWLDERDGTFLDSGWSLDAGLSLDWATQTFNISGSPQAFTVINLGEQPVPYMVIEVLTDGSAALSDFTLTNITNGMRFRYTTPLAASSRLRIEPLSRRITLNYTSDAYQGFVMPDVRQTSWMRLEPGNNAFELTYSSRTGTPTISFSFMRHYL